MSNEIEAIWANRELLANPQSTQLIRNIIDQLDRGELRVATPPSEESSDWTVNEWVKKAILLYFVSQQMKTEEVGIFTFNDKISLKSNFAEAKVRAVPPAVARYGSYQAPGVILMPSYVNI